LQATKEQDAESVEAWELELKEIQSVGWECEEWCRIATATAMRLKLDPQPIDAEQRGEGVILKALSLPAVVQEMVRLGLDQYPLRFIRF
jgi:hypothetical protein